MRRKHGKLTEEDREVWSKVAKSTDPLRACVVFQPEIDTPVRSFSQPRPVKTLTRIGAVKSDVRVTINLAPDTIGRSGAQMDRKNYDRLRKGKLRPDARLDMHGMTADQAHSELTAFIYRAHAAGKRLALVITGKGSSSRSDTGIMSTRHGILRHSVPHWLDGANMRSMILEITPAHIKHGGDGAYYVYLKRQRG